MLEAKPLQTTQSLTTTLDSPIAETQSPTPNPQPPSFDARSGITDYASRARSLFKSWNRRDAFAPPAVALLIIGTFSLLTLADPGLREG